MKKQTFSVSGRVKALQAPKHVRIYPKNIPKHPLTPTSNSRPHASLSLILFISPSRKLIFTAHHAPIIAVIFNAIITPRHTRKPVNGSHFSNYRFRKTSKILNKASFVKSSPFAGRIFRPPRGCFNWNGARLPRKQIPSPSVLSREKPAIAAAEG